MKPSYLWVNTFQGSITMKFPLQKTCLSFFNKQTDFITFGIFSVHLYYLLFWKLQRSCFKGKMYGIKLIWSTDLQLAQPPLGHGLFESLSVGILCCLILPAKEDEHMVISQAVHSPPPTPTAPAKPIIACFTEQRCVWNLESSWQDFVDSTYYSISWKHVCRSQHFQCYLVVIL